jgi:predicted RNase H-like HicB family nuclease
MSTKSVILLCPRSPEFVIHQYRYKVSEEKARASVLACRSWARSDNPADSCTKRVKMVYTAGKSNTWGEYMPTYRYTVVFEPAEEGGYVVHVPALNGAATQGETLEEAREMAKDLIAGYLEALAKDGIPAPIEEFEPIQEPVREIVEVSLV